MLRHAVGVICNGQASRLFVRLTDCLEVIFIEDRDTLELQFKF